MRERRRRSQSSTSSPTWVELPLQEPAQEQAMPPLAGERIDVLISDLAVELGDSARTQEHQGTVRRLWGQSKRPEGELAQILMQVRARATRLAQPGRPAAG